MNLNGPRAYKVNATDQFSFAEDRMPLFAGKDLPGGDYTSLPSGEAMPAQETRARIAAINVHHEYDIDVICLSAYYLIDSVDSRIGLRHQSIDRPPDVAISIQDQDGIGMAEAAIASWLVPNV